MKTLLVLAILIATINAINIECEFKTRFWWYQFGQLYTCEVKSIELTGSHLVETVAGIHRSGKSNDDVKQIWFGYKYLCGINYIPQNIHKHFPSIIGILFYNNCTIQSLTGDELKDYVNLEWFDINRNSIERIPGNLFENNRKLKAVGFENNNITNVGYKLLSGLEHLTSASFAGNKCTNEFFHLNRARLEPFIANLEKHCPDFNENI
jgi:Leucine-rich repeat (LRR) protein